MPVHLYIWLQVQKFHHFSLKVLKVWIAVVAEDEAPSPSKPGWNEVQPAARWKGALVSSTKLCFFQVIQNFPGGFHPSMVLCSSLCVCNVPGKNQQRQRSYLTLNRIHTGMGLGVKLLISRKLALWVSTSGRNPNPYLRLLQGVRANLSEPFLPAYWPWWGQQALCARMSWLLQVARAPAQEGNLRQNLAGLSLWQTQLHLLTSPQPPEKTPTKTHQLAVVRPWVNYAWWTHSQTHCLSERDRCR